MRYPLLQTLRAYGLGRLQAQQSTAADVPGFIARLCHVVLEIVLADVGDYDAAREVCAAGLTWSREAEDLVDLANLLMAGAHLEGLAGNTAQMRAYLHEAVDVAARTGDHINLRNSLEEGGYLCAATGRWAEAVTLWAANAADVTRTGIPGNYSAEYSRRRECLRRIEGVLGPAQVRDAEARGARMTLAAAAGLLAMLTAPRETAPGARRRADRAGAGAGHPGRPGRHQRADRRQAVHQRPHRQLPPGPDPGQDRLPPPRRPHPPGPSGGSRLALRPDLGAVKRSPRSPRRPAAPGRRPARRCPG